MKAIPLKTHVPKVGRFEMWHIFCFALLLSIFFLSPVCAPAAESEGFQKVAEQVHFDLDAANADTKKQWNGSAQSGKRSSGWKRRPRIV